MITVSVNLESTKADEYLRDITTARFIGVSGKLKREHWVIGIEDYKKHKEKLSRLNVKKSEWQFYCK